MQETLVNEEAPLFRTFHSERTGLLGFQTNFTHAIHKIYRSACHLCSKHDEANEEMRYYLWRTLARLSSSISASLKFKAHVEDSALVNTRLSFVSDGVATHLKDTSLRGYDTSFTNYIWVDQEKCFVPRVMAKKIRRHRVKFGTTIIAVASSTIQKNVWLLAEHSRWLRTYPLNSRHIQLVPCVSGIPVYLTGNNKFRNAQVSSLSLTTNGTGSTS